ncbi:MAG: DUF721 domain-containing protein [Alphaproteobacteria bacterium]|nr:DUF721 domain-containing protein [Alphaproteobacteria bacterium]MDD9919402.1 DUF721 domain-containing protein [Alphaproteobacteria bacterium]
MAEEQAQKIGINKATKWQRRSGFNPLAARLPTVMRRHARRQGFVEADILQRWHHICPEYARYSYPAKMWKGKLTITVSSDSAKQALQYMQPVLIQKINGFYGYEAVTAIRLVTKYFEVSAVKKEVVIQVDEAAVLRAAKQCSLVKDASLRGVLEKLGSQIYTKERQKSE